MPGSAPPLPDSEAPFQDDGLGFTPGPMTVMAPGMATPPNRMPGAPSIPAAKLEAASAMILGTVPMGGAGTGCIEVAADGRFRQLSINNNRNPSQWISASPNTFLAVRVAYEGEPPIGYILQRDSRSQNTGLVPLSRIPKEAFNSRGIFPLLHFFAHAESLPFGAVWMLFAPVIPFDVEASVLPMLLSRVVMRNRSKKPATVSVMFHLEHLCGRQGEDPLIPRPVSARHIEEEDAPPPKPGEPTPHNSLLFESGASAKEWRDCDGEQCITVRGRGEGIVSVGAYNATNMDRCLEFWDHFMARGDLPTGLVGGAAEYGAVCWRFTLQSKEERQTDFVWTWNCPDFHAHDGESMGNGYSCLMEDAVATARRGLKHGKYYHDSVLDWQQRLHTSTLPKWLVKELINSARVFTRNGLYSDDARFGMQASPLDLRVGDVATRLYSSFGTLLFLPRFEEEELSLACRARDPRNPTKLCHSLGIGSLHHPQAELDEAGQMLLAANLAISAYRNYLLTGSLVHARKRFSTLHDSIQSAIALDYDNDGFPEGGAEHAALHLNASSCGLWMLGLRCYALLAYDRDARLDAEHAEKMYSRAQGAFESYFWNAAQGTYCLWREGHQPDDESAAELRFHLGQMAGEWQAGLLGLGPLHPTEHIAKTLHHLAARLDDDVSTMSPNLFADPDGVNRAMAHAGSLLVHRDRVTVGLKLIERMLSRCERVHGAGRRQRTSSLAVWHVFQAIHGVTLNMARQQLRVLPHLPPEVQYLSTPVFTPAGLCWLKYHSDPGPPFRQRIHVSFDSPTNIASILVRLPLKATKMSVVCEMPDGKVPCKTDVMPGEQHRLGLITLERALYAGSAFSLDITAE